MSVFWFFLVVFSCQVWLQHLSKIFDLQSSCCLLLPSLPSWIPLLLNIPFLSVDCPLAPSAHLSIVFVGFCCCWFLG
jgi:hypothetical protein